jgi:hypothetical protein
MIGVDELRVMFGNQIFRPVGIKTLLSPSWLTVSTVLDSGRQYSKECREIRSILDSKFPDLHMPQDTLNKTLSEMADDGDGLIDSDKVPLENLKKNAKLFKKHSLLLAGVFRLSMNQRFIFEVLDLVEGMSTNEYKGRIEFNLVLTPLNVLILAILYQNKTLMTPSNILVYICRIKSVHTNVATKDGASMSKASMAATLHTMKEKGFVSGEGKKGYTLVKGDIDRFLMTIKFFRELEALWTCPLVH